MIHNRLDNKTGFPEKSGLYDPACEKESCGAHCDTDLRLWDSGDEKGTPAEGGSGSARLPGARSEFGGVWDPGWELRIEAPRCRGAVESGRDPPRGPTRRSGRGTSRRPGRRGVAPREDHGR